MRDDIPAAPEALRVDERKLKNYVDELVRSSVKELEAYSVDCNGLLEIHPASAGDDIDPARTIAGLKSNVS